MSQLAFGAWARRTSFERRLIVMCSRLDRKACQTPLPLRHIDGKDGACCLPLVFRSMLLKPGLLLPVQTYVFHLHPCKRGWP